MSKKEVLPLDLEALRADFILVAYVLAIAERLSNQEAQELKPLKDVIIIFDLDGTIKKIKTVIKRGEIAHIDEDMIAFLHYLEELGAQVVIATNNPLRQHFLTNNRILKELNEGLSNLQLFYSTLYLIWPLPWFQAKNRENKIDLLAKNLAENHNQTRAVVVIGNSPNDITLGRKIAQLLDSPQFIGLRLKSIFDFLPDKIRKLLPM